MLQELKVQHRGEWKGVWEEWVEGATMEEIRGQVEAIVADMGARQKCLIKLASRKNYLLSSCLQTCIIDYFYKDC